MPSPTSPMAAPQGETAGNLYAGAWENKRDPAYGAPGGGTAFDATDACSAQAGDGREAVRDAG